MIGQQTIKQQSIYRGNYCPGFIASYQCYQQRLLLSVNSTLTETLRILSVLATANRLGYYYTSNFKAAA